MQDLLQGAFAIDKDKFFVFAWQLEEKYNQFVKSKVKPTQYLTFIQTRKKNGTKFYNNFNKDPEKTDQLLNENLEKYYKEKKVDTKNQYKNLISTDLKFTYHKKDQFNINSTFISELIFLSHEAELDTILETQKQRNRTDEPKRRKSKKSQKQISN